MCKPWRTSCDPESCERDRWRERQIRREENGQRAAMEIIVRLETIVTRCLSGCFWQVLPFLSIPITSTHTQTHIHASVQDFIKLKVTNRLDWKQRKDETTRLMPKNEQTSQIVFFFFHKLKLEWRSFQIWRGRHNSVCDSQPSEVWEKPRLGKQEPGLVQRVWVGESYSPDFSSVRKSVAMSGLV